MKYTNDDIIVMLKRCAQFIQSMVMFCCVAVEVVRKPEYVMRYCLLSVVDCEYEHKR